MGWLGWSEKDALDADVNSIMVAMEGRLEMMYPGTKFNKKSISSEQIKSLFKAHNATFQRK